MGEAQEQAAKIIVLDTKETTSPESQDAGGSRSHAATLGRYKWWLQMVVFTFFVLSGQSVATLLGRLYFDKGGKSKWMATLVQTAGFPILLPFLFIFSPETNNAEEEYNTSNPTKKPSLITLVLLYFFIGIFVAADCMLYTIGLNFLPVSTYSVICASQLAFNAFFSYFLNAQKLTPFIVNSLFLLTVSSTLLVFQTDSKETNKISKTKYVIGFICTVGASAGYGLMLSVTQLAFRKILKTETFRVVFDMIIYQCLVATLAILVGLFASGEWKTIKGEMEDFESGSVPYVMNLVGTAVSWQVFSIGCVGLIFKVSSLFANVISALGLPIVPVFAVVFFHDSMNGVKVISMLLAVWGFSSYIYQNYLDDLKLKAENRIVNHEVPLAERGISQ